MQNAYLDSLCIILEALCKSYNKVYPTTKMLEECQHPASSANYWITKWVDYSEKFGFGKSSRKTVSWMLVTDIGQVWDVSDRINMFGTNIRKQVVKLMIPPQTSQTGNHHKVIHITMSSLLLSTRFSGTKNSAYNLKSRFDQFIKILLPVKVTPSVIILLASSSMIWVIFYYTLMVKKFNTLTTVFAKRFALLNFIHRNSRKWSHKWFIAENTWRKI